MRYYAFSADGRQLHAVDPQRAGARDRDADVGADQLRSRSASYNAPARSGVADLESVGRCQSAPPQVHGLALGIRPIVTHCALSPGTPSIACRRGRRDCPSPRARRSGAGPSSRLGLPLAITSPAMSSARGSCGSPLTVISRYEPLSFETHCAVSSPGTLTNGVLMALGAASTPLMRAGAQVGVQLTASAAERGGIGAARFHARLRARGRSATPAAAESSSGTTRR